MVVVFTGRVGEVWPDALDTTFKSGSGLGAVLAPTHPLVYGYKAGLGDQRFVGRYMPLTQRQYTGQYLGLLRNRWQRQPELFRQLLDRDSITLTCYCAKGCFCHRLLLAKIVLPKLAAHYGIPYQYGGER